MAKNANSGVRQSGACTSTFLKVKISASLAVTQRQRLAALRIKGAEPGHGRDGIQREPQRKSHDSEDDKVKLPSAKRYCFNSPFMFSEEAWEVRQQPASTLGFTKPRKQELPAEQGQNCAPKLLLAAYTMPQGLPCVEQRVSLFVLMHTAV